MTSMKSNNVTEGMMKSLEERMVKAVSNRIGVQVTFSHWVRKVTGDVPVFIVPKSHHQRAAENGLTVA